MQMLGAAKSQAEILKICDQFSNSCVLREYASVPLGVGWPALSWGQLLPATSRPAPKPNCKLWVADLHRSPNCSVALGSWMLACMPIARDSQRLATLFSTTRTRWCETPQPMVLVQPGFSWPRLLRQARTQWTIAFVELEERKSWQ
jgi:hypothetical protein